MRDGLEPSFFIPCFYSEFIVKLNNYGFKEEKGNSGDVGRGR